MANHYDVGNLVRVSCEFKVHGALADPTGVVAKFETPANADTTYTYGVDGALVKDATGRYHFDIDVTAAGTWTYRFNGTGTGQAAIEGTFIAKATTF